MIAPETPKIPASETIAPDTETELTPELENKTPIQDTLNSTTESMMEVEVQGKTKTPYDTEILSFLDIKNSPYQSTIQHFRSLALINGTPQGNFEPQRQITRAEFTKLVLLSHCYEYSQIDAKKPIFTDLTANSWEARVAHKAYELGIINGFEDGTFKAEQLITKAEALKILLRMAYIQTQDTDPLGYTDIETQWQKSYVETAQTLGILDPKKDNNTFKPNEGVQREEMLSMIKSTVALYR